MTILQDFVLLHQNRQCPSCPVAEIAKTLAPDPLFFAGSLSFLPGLCHHGVLGERTDEAIEEDCLLDHRSQLAPITL
jgi:hypothetical protein